MMELRTANRKSNVWIVSLAVVVTSAIIFFIERKVLSQTGGIFSYPVDDVYIHMELAKNLAFHGTWGINPGEFASASSSPFYTVLLAVLFRIFSPNLLFPFLINCIAGLLLLIVICKWLQKQNISFPGQLAILIALVFLMPLPVLVISGMEHTLQSLFSFLFIFSLAHWLQNQPGDSKSKIPWSVILYGVLTVSIRYEGLFLVGMACLFLLLQKSLGAALKLGFVAAAPIIVFGIYSLSKGSYALPNSVLIKSGAAQFSGSGLAGALGNIFTERLFLSKPGITLLATQRLLFILPMAYLIFQKRLKEQTGYRFLLITLTGAVFLQLALADTGKFYRYEAYLIVCSVVAVMTLMFLYGKELWSFMDPLMKSLSAFLFFILIFPVVLRSTAAFSKAGRACVNIFEQQYQMGQFLHRYYDTASVAANDIGAVSYFSNGKVIDLWGLGNIEIAKSRKQGYWTSEFVDSFSRQKNVKLAMVYDSWVGPVLPKQWKKVATWQIFENVVCGDDFVSFYAVDSTGAVTLKTNLVEFRSKLPPTVKQEFY